MSTPSLGLCASCAYKKVVISDRGSEFMRCLNPKLPKYPRLPVIHCPGFSQLNRDRQEAD